MGTAAAQTVEAPPLDSPAARAGDVVRELQARIRRMQAPRLDSRALPTLPALAPLLPGGALHSGAAYAVEGSTALGLSLLAGPSQAGSWCAVVGVPDLGLEATASLGVELDRLVLVPHPGEQWLGVVSALVDVVSVVLTRPPVLLSEGIASRLAARLRQRGVALVSLGGWPRSEATLTVSDSSWSGIGGGFGHLEARQLTVRSVASSAGRQRSRRLWLPAAEGGVHAVSPALRAVPDGGPEMGAGSGRSAAG